MIIVYLSDYQMEQDTAGTKQHQAKEVNDDQRSQHSIL